MRARNIKPGIFKNEILGAQDPILTLLFEGLWCLADREGRLEDRPLRIKAEVFPYRDLDVNGDLTVLSRLGFILRYEAPRSSGSSEKIKVIQVLNFHKHQHPHNTEKKSDLPAPVSSPLSNGETPSDLLIPDSLYIPVPKKSPKSGSKKTKKTPLPENFSISEDLRRWGEENGHSRLEEHLQYFIGYAKANGKTYADWTQAFQNAVRGNWAKLPAEKKTKPFDVLAHTRELMKG
jgi:hypothetical protein